MRPWYILGCGREHVPELCCGNILNGQRELVFELPGRVVFAERDGHNECMLAVPSRKLLDHRKWHDEFLYAMLSRHLQQQHRRYFVCRVQFVLGGQCRSLSVPFSKHVSSWAV